MTGSEWLTSVDPRAMLEFVQDSGRASDRKLRLFACACCRRVLHLLPDPLCLRALVAAERYADGALDGASYDLAAFEFDTKRRARFPKYPTPDDPAWNALYCAVHRRWGEAFDESFGRKRWELAAAVARDAGAAGGPQEREAANLLRDIFGNPIQHPATVTTSLLDWHDGLVVNLAQAAYEDRTLPSGHLDPDRLAVLADALTDAGCNDAELLGHLRGPGVHVRGCWAVDLLTGRE